MFRLIAWDKLVEGEVYLIEHDIKARFASISYGIPSPCIEFDFLTPELNMEYRASFFTDTNDYYEFVKQKEKIQSDMERRAVNLIVRRLIGDDCFEW